MLFFGPDSGRPIPSLNGEVDDRTGGTGQLTSSPKAPASAARKHARENGPNGIPLDLAQPAPKRSRKSNGVERNGDEQSRNSDESALEIERNGYVHSDAGDQAPTGAKSPTPGDAEMDMGVGASEPQDTDQDQDQERLPEPEPTPTFTLANGYSVGVQITPAKGADLGPETTILGVADCQHVTQAVWHPSDPCVLATSGQTHCRIWKISSQRSTLLGPTQSTHEDLFDKSDNNAVTAVAWDPMGRRLAVATWNNVQEGTLNIYDSQGTLVESLPTSQDMITALRWQDQGDRGDQLLGITSDGANSELIVWDVSSFAHVAVPSQAVNGLIQDATWVARDQVYASSTGVVYDCRVDEGIGLSRTFSSGESQPETWDIIKSSKTQGHLIAAAAAADTASLWFPSFGIHVRGAHDAPITALEFYHQSRYPGGLYELCELATSSMDGTVKMWTMDWASKEVQCTHRLPLGHATPAMVFSFSPNGAYIAAASYQKVIIWDVDRGGNPVATWDGEGTDWQKLKEEATNGVTEGDVGEKEPVHSLSWDPHSKRLAYGLRNQVWI